MRPHTTETHTVLRTILNVGMLAVLLVLACAGAAAGATRVYGNCHRLRSFQAISLSAAESDPRMLGTESVTPPGHLLYTDAVGRHLGYHDGELKDEIPNTELEPGRGYRVMIENNCVWGHEI